VPVNHLEGHILSALAKTEDNTLIIGAPQLPILALGIAGGHTDMLVMYEWLAYEVIGQTLDDSVGEAFDKVARMLGLPYPGGPHISKLAEMSRAENLANPYTFPRPMIHSETYEFSFSGLKTSVLYLLKGISVIDDTVRKQVAREFEDAVTEVLWSKTQQALEEKSPKILILSGGVSANKYIRKIFTENIEKQYPHVALYFPSIELATDNAVMIGLAGFYRYLRGERATPGSLKANGNLSLAGK
jgi:N6-L-threonylcarbamoyladenine synthase